MTEAYFQVRLAGDVAKTNPSSKVLVPAGDEDYERLRARPVDEVLKCVFKLERNYAFLKKGHALIRFAFDCQSAYPNTKAGLDEFRDAVTIEAGFSEERKNMEGQTYLVAKSWSFDNMDEIEFTELFNAMIAAILKHSETVFNGVDSAVFERQLLHFAGDT